jgi:hypothetical protein
MLGLWFSFWAIHIVQTDPGRQFRILPEVEKDEQINEEGSTLTLTCMDKDMPFHIERFYPEVDGMKWQPPLSQVIKLISIKFSILNAVTRTRVFSSGKMVGKEEID